MSKQPLTIPAIHGINEQLFNTNLAVTRAERTLLITSCLLASKLGVAGLKENIANIVFEAMHTNFSDAVTAELLDLLRAVDVYSALKFIDKYVSLDNLLDLPLVHMIYTTIEIKKTMEDYLPIPLETASLMISELKIQPNETFIDLSTGIGTLPMIVCKSINRRTEIMGCDIQPEYYSLARIVFTMNGMNEIYCANCYDLSRRDFDTSAINAPLLITIHDGAFQSNFTKELKLLDFQQTILKEGTGRGCILLPSKHFVDGPSHVKFKKYFLEKCTPIKIFTNILGAYCIMVYLKKPYANEVVQIISSQTLCLALTPTNNWTCTHNDDVDLEAFAKIYRLSMLQRHFNVAALEIERQEYNLSIPQSLMKPFKFDELFTLVGNGDRYIRISKSGPYPLIGASSDKCGVVKYISEFDFDGDYFTLALSELPGTCYHHVGKFSVTNSVSVLKLTMDALNRDALNRDALAAYVTTYFKNKYPSNTKLTVANLKRVTINIPVNVDGKIDFSLLGF
jgi:hypothetical protein